MNQRLKLNSKYSRHSREGKIQSASNQIALLAIFINWHSISNIHTSVKIISHSWNASPPQIHLLESLAFLKAQLTCYFLRKCFLIFLVVSASFLNQMINYVFKYLYVVFSETPRRM